MKKLIQALCVLTMAFAVAAAEDKRDVSDPVLKEIITSFSPRMPRFIDKHGKEVFVSDGPVTRGSLMLALYEYDKSFRLSKKESVSRQEFDALAARVAFAESGPRKKSEEKAAALDTMQIINDLMPNMPLLLDNSLNDSKVFQNLKAEVGQRGGAVITADVSDVKIRADLEQARADLSELNYKVKSLEKSGSSTASGESAEVKKKLAQTREQLSKLEQRVNLIEKSEGKSKDEYARAENAQSGSTALSKLSMGLSMVAALFIAR